MRGKQRKSNKWKVSFHGHRSSMGCLLRSLVLIILSIYWADLKEWEAQDRAEDVWWWRSWYMLIASQDGLTGITNMVHSSDMCKRWPAAWLGGRDPWRRREHQSTHRLPSFSKYINVYLWIYLLVYIICTYWNRIRRT